MIRLTADDELDFFKQKPIITVEKIKTETKNLFSTYRVFQIHTTPGNFVVNRCRDDFRWLSEKLMEEYPNNTQLVQIEKGQLSKKVLEDYFDYLIQKQGMGHSRYLKFFLCTADVKFQARKERDDSYLRGIYNKLFNGSSLTEEDLNLSETKKISKLTVDEDNNLHTYLDELHETIKLNKAYFQK